MLRTRRLQSLLATLACLIPMLALDCVFAQLQSLPQSAQPASAIAEPASDVRAEQSNVLSPLEVLDDAVAAVADGDFARYADHLTADEQSMQAGFVVAMLTMIQQFEILGEENPDPEMILVTRAMDDLLREHTRSAEAYQETQVDSAEAQQQLIGQLMLASMMSSGDATPVNGMVPGMPGLLGGDVRGASLKAAELLKAPREFLVDALSELMQPMTITRQGVKESKTLVALPELMQHYESAVWTLYERGSYAVAVAELPEPEANEDEATSHQLVPVEETSRTVVEFRRIDGQWKIARLLPSDVIRGGGFCAVSSSENPAAVVTPLAAPSPYAPSYINTDELQYATPSPSYPINPPAVATPQPLVPQSAQPVLPSAPTGTPIGLPAAPPLPQ